MFKQKDGVGQEALFNVMKAYSVHDREVTIVNGDGGVGDGDSGVDGEDDVDSNG